MDDDFNTGGAVSDLFDMNRCLNRFIEAEGLRIQERTEANVEILVKGVSILREMAAILGIFTKAPKQANGAGDGFG